MKHSIIAPRRRGIYQDDTERFEPCTFSHYNKRPGHEQLELPLPTDLSTEAKGLTSQDLAGLERPSKDFVYAVAKRTLDVVIALLALPFILLVSLVILALNPFFNKGPLIFAQERMGQDFVPFTALKFRTMAPADGPTRGHDDPVEHDRVTKLGAILRRSRIDELPQFLNILRGDMALVGPRPDMVEHAREFTKLIPSYRHRYSVRPGLTGLAQVTYGYVEGVRATRFKAAADLAYIRNAGLLLDLKVIWMTVGALVALDGK